MIRLLQKLPFVRARWLLPKICPQQTAQNFRHHLQRQLGKPAIKIIQSGVEQ